MNLRKLARGRPCMVRIPGVCDGVGLKSPDLLGAWCCAPCHASAGDRGPELAVAVMRTQAKLIEEGVL